jgi:hypothetical protein
MGVRRIGVSVAVCAALAASACGGGLKPTLIQAAHRKPSNVAVFFAVNDDDGEPVANLLSSDFNIYEDGKLVSRDESRQTIVNPEIAAVHYTLLLVDMSASVTESDQVGRIVAASNEFIARVEKFQKVAVYAFDGSPNLYEITPFTQDEARAEHGVDKLNQFVTKDPSTNLHGAIVQALDKLKTGLKGAKVPLRFGTLVVFTDGTDRAARVPQQDMQDAIDASQYSVFAIGVGNEIDDATLSRIGRDGYIRVENSEALSDAFKQIGDRIVRFTRRYYLLSYCSPARAGKHTVTIEATTKRQKGKLSYDFDANGFGPDCDATRPPPFDTEGRSVAAREKLGITDEPEHPEKPHREKKAEKHTASVSAEATTPTAVPAATPAASTPSTPAADPAKPVNAPKSASN